MISSPLPSSRICVHSSSESSRFDWQDLILLNPCWCWLRRLLSSRCATVCVFTNRSITLHTWEVRLTGLQLLGALLFPFLNMGTIIALFQSCGNWPFFIVFLNSVASSPASCSAQARSTVEDIPSGPGALSRFNFLSSADTSPGVISTVVSTSSWLICSWNKGIPKLLSFVNPC